MHSNVEYMSEVWFKTFNPIYFINHHGQVRTFDRCEYMPYKNEIKKVTRRGKILTSIKMNNGYLYVDFSSYGKVKRISVHRLMAKTFLQENIEDKHVHHIDENRENNELNNLEVVDSKLHCSEHNFKRSFKNKTGYRGVHQVYNGFYRGSIQRSGKKTIYTKTYNNPKSAYEELQHILQCNEDNK